VTGTVDTPAVSLSGPASVIANALVSIITQALQ
jgi:hypothetical protein